ncbi:MAG: hypothetical protein R3F17_05910 [Planctomycetota bacterium]
MASATEELLHTFRLKCNQETLQGEQAMQVLCAALYAQGFAMSVSGQGSGRCLWVFRDTSGGMAPVFVDSSAVSKLDNYPGLMVATVIHLPGQDMRSISNTLRTLIRNANLETLIPLGSSDRILVSGPVQWTSALVLALETLYPTSAEQPGPPEPETFMHVLQNRTAAELGPVLEEIGILPVGCQDGRKRVGDYAILPQINAVVVVASDQAHAVVAKKIQEFDKPAAAEE